MIGNQQKIYEANMEQIDVSCLLLHVQLIDVNIIIHVYASIEIQSRVIVTNVLCIDVHKFTSGIIGFISMFSITVNSYFLKIMI